MADEILFCPGCGAKLTSNLNFCYKCGTNVSKLINEIKDKETIKCPNCGALNPLDTNVCMKCWAKIDPQAETEEDIATEVKGTRKVTYSVSYEESNSEIINMKQPDKKINESEPCIPDRIIRDIHKYVRYGKERPTFLPNLHFNCEARWYLIKGEPSTNLSTLRTDFGKDGWADWHRHETADQAYYVLNGNARVWVDSEDNFYDISKGDTVIFQRNRHHKIKNIGGSKLSLLAINAPAL